MRRPAAAVILINSLLMAVPAIAEPYYRGAEVSERMETEEGEVISR